ncbi:hypothetical protein BDP27DRAFT_1316044 [Rhodocollybia butyracea]|uniref:SHSP domain-containing protein n=1 Tax=Rhodocollybia butyracea TaxID=206335 RepID=A0A9P5Q4W4_9AGAR|nr:hypothetical protein BDP27DRAFT_1316044 [Rhodocollybia butyracea]
MYYHHSGQYQRDDNNLSSDSATVEHPPWETLDNNNVQQPQDSSPSDHSTYNVSPVAPIPHSLPPQHFEFSSIHTSPLHTPPDFGENTTNLLFPQQQVPVIGFPQELLQPEGYPSPDTEYHHASPSPTTPTAGSIPQTTTRSRTNTRITGPRGIGGTGTQHPLHRSRPYSRPPSAMSGRRTESAGAKFSVVPASFSGIQPYPASMSAPEPSHSSPSTTMLPPLTIRRQTSATSPTASTSVSRSSMGPPAQPPSQPMSQPQLLPAAPRSSQPPRFSSSILPPPAAAPSTAFASIIQQLRSGTKQFYQPRLDCHYDQDSCTLKAFIELPGIRRENVHVSLSNSAVNRIRGINVWGYSLPPYHSNAAGTGANAGTSSAVQGASSMTGTTMHDSGSLSTSSPNAASTPSASVNAPMHFEAAGSSAPSWSGNSAGAADTRPLLPTSALQSFAHNFPPHYASRERKYGEFFRLLPVPPETRATHVHATLEAGILYLSIAFGAPLNEEQVNMSREVITVL